MPPSSNKLADYTALGLATGTYIFLCALIWMEYQSTGQLNPWMLASLITMLLLSLGTLFGFGRLSEVLDRVPVSFGGKE